MMAQRSRPEIANGKPRARTGGALLAVLLAGTVLGGGVPDARAQTQYAPYGNPFAGGPVPYSALQGGSQGYAQVPYQQPYGAPAYGNPYGGGQAVVGGGGSIVYDPSVLGGGGYQAPFYAGVAAQQGFQYATPTPYGAGPVPYGAAQVQAPNGVYGQAGGLLVPGPVAPQSQLYIQPGVAAPGYAQAQIGAATGALPPPPPPTSTASTSTGAVSAAVGSTGTAALPSARPQVATATPPTPPTVPEIAPPPPPSTDSSSSGPARVPVIVEETAPPPPPPPPPTASVTPPPPPAPPSVDVEEPEDDRTVAEILQPPPPPVSAEEPAEDERAEVAAVTPPPPPPPAAPSSDAPALTPAVRSDAPPPPPTPEPEAPQPPEVASTELPTIPTPPPPEAPTAVTDGSVALSIPFGGGESDLPPASEDELRAIAQQMAADDTLRLTIRAYAEGTAEDASQARRLSLSRALAIRSFLIEQGIRGPRMDVRALGHRIEPPRDRVDLVLVSQ